MGSILRQRVVMGSILSEGLVKCSILSQGMVWTLDRFRMRFRVSAGKFACDVTAGKIIAEMP